MTQKPYKDHALALFEKGYAPLPMPTGLKFPPPDGWTGRMAPMPSYADVYAWTESHESGNIALRLPKGVIVIDVDDYDGKGARDTMQLAIDTLGPLPVIGRISSRNDGISGHRFFRVPEDVVLVNNLKVANFGPGVDILQHHHRYSIAPGSVHPEGGVYQWFGAPGYPELPAVADLPELPQAWVEALDIRNRDGGGDLDGSFVDPNGFDYSEFTDIAKAKADEYVAEELQRIWDDLEAMKTWPVGYEGEHGGWDASILHHTFRLASLVHASWNPLTPEDVMHDLAAHLPHDAGYSLQRGVAAFARALDKESVAGIPNSVLNANNLEPEQAEQAMEWPKRPLNAQGNAERFVQWAQGRYLYIADLRQWVARNPETGQWETNPEPGLLAIRGVVEALEQAAEHEQYHYSDAPPTDGKGQPKGGPTEREKFLHYLGDRGARYAEDIARRVMASADRFGLLAHSSEFDANPMELLTKDGHVVNLADGSVRAVNHEDRFLKMVDARYTPGVRPQRFTSFLESSLPDVEVRMLLQRILGYSITGRTDEQKIFIHHGSKTANGKSTLTKILHSILGSHAVPANSKALLRQPGGRFVEHEQDIMDMVGYRLVILNETREGASLEDEGIKGFTGGDKRAGRRLYSGNETYEIIGKVHLFTNHLPHINVDPAMKRRIVIIPWEQSFEKNPDRRLSADLEAEKDAIFSWLVEGARDWYEEFTRTNHSGLPEVVDIELAREEYFESEDDVARFLADETDRMDGQDDSHWDSSQVLYASYVEWCGREGIDRYKMSQKAFARRLSSILGVGSRQKWRDGRNLRIYPLKVKPGIGWAVRE